MEILKFWSTKTAPFIIAEMSGNHNQSLERALQLVDAAASAGAHAIKLQTYTADTMTLPLRDKEFIISDPTSIWAGQSLYDLYEKAHTPWDWHKPIMDRARERGIYCFSSPFDETAVDFLETLDVPAYKIASFECVDLPLVRRVAATGKPVVISTGLVNIVELAETVRTIEMAGCRNFVLLKCTSTYPASPEFTNLRTLPHMRDLFQCEVGISDHTRGIGTSVAAVALGAVIIEKHLTLNRKDGGVDSAFSLEPMEFKYLVEETERAWKSLGKIQYEPEDLEQKGQFRRRSLYIGNDMKKGDTFTEKNLRRVRPGYGLAPKYYEFLLGRKIKKDVKKGTPLAWDMIL